MGPSLAPIIYLKELFIHYINFLLSIYIYMFAIQSCSYLVASTYIFSLVKNFTDLVLQCYIVITLMKPQNVLHNTYYIHVEVFHSV